MLYLYTMKKKEIWECVSGYFGMYLISNQGRLKRLKNGEYVISTLYNNGGNYIQVRPLSTLKL